MHGQVTAITKCCIILQLVLRSVDMKKSFITLSKAQPHAFCPFAIEKFICVATKHLIDN